MIDYKMSFFKHEEAAELSDLFRKITVNIPYYNDLAKAEEVKCYEKDILVEKINENPLSILVGHLEGRIISYCITHFDCYTLWIDWFGVDEEFRRRGYAKTLLLELEEVARKQSCHKIWCDSRSSNIQSISLFRSLGYEMIANIKNHWYGQDFVLLEKVFNDE